MLELINLSRGPGESTLGREALGAEIETDDIVTTTFLLDEEERAALAYEFFGPDDEPEIAEAYAFTGQGKLRDANLDPPLTWSDATFLRAAPALRATFARGLIGSTYAYAHATDQEELGVLCSPALKAAFQARQVREWIVDELAEMALNAAPITLDSKVASDFYWRAPTAQQANDLSRLLLQEMPKGLTHVIVMPWLASGGAELEAIWHARAVTDAGGVCLMLATDGRREEWVSHLPKGAHYLYLGDLVEKAGLWGHVSNDDMAIALAAALSQTPFRVMHVVNSYVATRMLRFPIDWGDRKIYYSLFGVGVDKHGLDGGYWTSARDLKGITAFISDNMAVPRRRAAGFGLSPDQFIGIVYPVEAGLRYSAIRRDTRGPRKVMWASRLDPEKQPEMVFEIAERMPEIEFHMFGRGILSDGELPTPPDNVILKGAYDGWESLPLEPYECFLFTSSGVGEGMPNIILEAMGSGLPVVAASVGGVTDCLADGRGWLIDEVKDPEAYIAALEQVLGDPAEASRRARAALLDVTRNRTYAHLQQTLIEIGYI